MLDFKKSGGLVPAIVQDDETGEVLMLAYMNRESWERTCETRVATYFSRSRNKLWVKGETSGNVLDVQELRSDCDGDALLILVKPRGPACHTGRRDCFYNRVQGDRLVVDKEPLIDPGELYGK